MAPLTGILPQEARDRRSRSGIEVIQTVVVPAGEIAIEWVPRDQRESA